MIEVCGNGLGTRGMVGGVLVVDGMDIVGVILLVVAGMWCIAVQVVGYLRVGVCVCVQAMGMGWE